jgi:hypothetical protein
VSIADQIADGANHVYAKRGSSPVAIQVTKEVYDGLNEEYNPIHVNLVGHLSFIDGMEITINSNLSKNEIMFVTKVKQFPEPYGVDLFTLDSCVVMLAGQEKIDLEKWEMKSPGRLAFKPGEKKPEKKIFSVD